MYRNCLRKGKNRGKMLPCGDTTLFTTLVNTFMMNIRPLPLILLALLASGCISHAGSNILSGSVTSKSPTQVTVINEGNFTWHNCYFILNSKYALYDQSGNGNITNKRDVKPNEVIAAYQAQKYTTPEGRSMTLDYGLEIDQFELDCDEGILAGDWKE